MTIPSVEHLFWLRHDKGAFERERNRLITEYMQSLPADKRRVAYAMQVKIDLARETMSNDEFLRWMANEAQKLAANLDDQVTAFRNCVRNSSVR